MSIFDTRRQKGFCKAKWCPSLQSFIFSLGHIHNDLAAAMWFSYMMLYFEDVLKIKSIYSAGLLFIGQIVDATATPIAGVLTHKYWTLKAWHMIGCVIVAVTFPLIFFRCWFCENMNEAFVWRIAYYATLIAFFQTGWALVQIAHLSMIPFIAENPEIRSELTSLRYLASVVASMTVYITTWLVLRHSTNSTAHITPDDDYKFRNIVLILSVIGIASFLLFFILFARREVKKTKDAATSTETATTGNEPTKLIHFLKMPVLYQTVLLFVSSRLFMTLSLVYLPLFLAERLYINPEHGSELIATVPWTLYISSFTFTMFLKFTIKYWGSQLSYLLGAFLSLSSSIWILLFIDPFSSVVHIYLVSALIGAGSSITVVSSLVITGELIGPHPHQGPAIYSIVSFADKLLTGIAVLIIELFNCGTCPEYYKGVLVYACGFSTLIGVVALFLAKIEKKKVVT